MRPSSRPTLASGALTATLFLSALGARPAAAEEKPAPAQPPASAPAPALPVPEARWCWTALSGDLEIQPLGFPSLVPTLAARGAEHLWLGWSPAGALSLYRRGGDGWELVPGPVDKSVDVHEPMLRLDAAGVPVLAWRTEAERDDSEDAPDAPEGPQREARKLEKGHFHVARWEGTGWVRLGEPLGSLESEPQAEWGERFSAMALDPRGHPVVVWREQGEGVWRLRAARWSGSAWEHLGREVVSSVHHFLEAPTVAVDARGTVWLAWVWNADDDRKEKDYGRTHQQHLRVARWNGKAWEDVGGTWRGSLRRSAWIGERVQLVLGEGGPVLAWREADRPRSWQVRLARWTGKRWERLVSPLALEKAAPGEPALLLPPDQRPILAWSETDASGLAHVYIQRLAPGGWEWLFRGLHLDEGASFTEEVLLEPRPEGGFLAVWDEPSDVDNKRLRGLHARPCAPGETPAPLPGIRTLWSFWPVTVEQAVERLVTEMDEKSKEAVRQTPREKLFRFHIGWGMGIRNAFGMWKGNTLLLESCGGGKLVHPDDCSPIIIRAVWERLQREQPAPASAPDAGP